MTAAQIRVLSALAYVYLRDGRATVATVARAVGRNTATTHQHLKALRRMGLVAYDAAGSLRPGEVS